MLLCLLFRLLRVFLEVNSIELNECMYIASYGTISDSSQLSNT
jgi:hypothetical protein